MIFFKMDQRGIKCSDQEMISRKEICGVRTHSAETHSAKANGAQIRRAPLPRTMRGTRSIPL